MSEKSVSPSKNSSFSSEDDKEESTINTRMTPQRSIKEKASKRQSPNKNLKNNIDIENIHELQIHEKLKQVNNKSPEIETSLLTYNVPEKIIIILDTANDENHTCFEIISGKKYSPLFMLQHALKLFLYNKSFIDSRHEFALMVLNENSAIWVHDFTHEAHDIIASIQSIIESPCEPEDVFDLTCIFNLINEKIDLNFNKDLSVPPPFVVRTVLLYGRSYSIPQLNYTSEIENLLNSPYFIVDVVMTHEPPDSANHCIRIFKFFQEIDTKGFAYSFAISRNAAELHCSMAKILSHPLQRSYQTDAVYELRAIK